MVSLGEIVGFPVMFGGELNDMCGLLKEVAVVEENTHGTLVPPITGRFATFCCTVAVALLALIYE
jgi:hypothetical protein